MNYRFIIKNYRHWLKWFALRKRGGRIEIGAHTYGAPRVRWWGERANLHIGKYCSIAEGVEIFLGGNHRTDWVSTYPFPLFRQWPEAKHIEGHPATRGDVTIGNDVWLGAGCVILSGVTIGNGAVIGCRSVVARDVPDYAIVAGNPATLVRMRFDAATISALLECSWWNWEPARIRSKMKLLLSADIDGFLREEA
ncbi:MAG: CatB-related O-acetyltransferase [Thiobacillus sp.]|jgi:acetyltransferase-like isoleucine patch superfamily enzyme